MSAAYDVIVAGLGAMGSAALHQLARRGHRVLGLDRFAPPHALGSSHGRSRIIREAYYEDPRYVPLVQRAYECWADLEAASGVTVFRRTGGLTLGPAGGELAEGARRSAAMHRLPHELLSAAEIRRRVPALQPDDDMIGVWEPRAGVLAPEAAIGAALAMARRHGAEVRLDTALRSWRAAADHVEVLTDAGTFHASRLVLAVGAWTRKVLAELDLPLAVERNVLLWFTPEPATTAFAPERFPVFLCEYAPGRAWYGFPDTGEGVKLALHHHGGSWDPDHLDREVRDEDVGAVRALARRYLPAANGALRETATCMYTTTPDGHFIIDRHPAHPHVVIASPCSGHGFKFASAIGEVLADLTEDRATTLDLSPFALARFRRPGS
ncbi:MAG TPA: N-methyl-L-tryptophan oxidase [Gemmatimonadales bacterium]|nr:N-methyl-L-tryptophan oxidase [Gemmatimonadales bacterium]